MRFAEGERGEPAGIAAGLLHLAHGGTAEQQFAVAAVEREFTCQGVGTAVLAGRQDRLVLPVAHPPERDGAPVGGVAEGHRGVMVFSPVHPLGAGGRLVREALAVERADEVLGGVAAEGAAGVDVADEHPFLFIGAFYWQFHQVGTFPHTAVRALFQAEGAFFFPLAEIGG